VVRKVFDSGSRKGQFSLIEAVYAIVFLFAFATVIFVGFEMFGDWNDTIQTDDTLSQANKDRVQSLYVRYPSVFDGAFMFLLVFMWLIVCIAAFNVINHPLLFLVGILFAVIMMVVVLQLANAFDDLMADATFSTVAASFPMTSFVMGNFAIITLILITSGMVSMYMGSRFAT